MRITEKALFILAITALILRLLLIPGAQVLVFFLVFLLCGYYFYFGFALFNGIGFRAIFKKRSYTGIPSNNILGGILAGVAMAIACVGIIFKLQHWPGAGIQLLFGTALCTIVFIVSIVKRRGAYPQFYKRILTRVTILLFFCFSLILIPKQILFEIMYRNRPALIEAQERSWADPTNQELRDKLQEEWHKIRHQ